MKTTTRRTLWSLAYDFTERMTIYCTCLALLLAVKVRLDWGLGWIGELLK